MTMKHKIQNQFSLYFFLFSVCPLLFLATFSYYNVRTNTERELSSTMIYNLKQSQVALDEKYTRFIKYVDIISNSPDFYDIIKLASKELNAGNYDIAQYNMTSLDKLLKSLFSADKEISHALIFIHGRCIYSYNGYFPVNAELFQDPILKALHGTLTPQWKSSVDMPFNYINGSYTVVSKDIKDIFTGNPQNSICQLVILLDQRALIDSLKSSGDYNGNVIAALDNNNQIIAITDSSPENIRNIQMEAEQIPPLGSANYDPLKSRSHGSHTFTYTISNPSGWKYIQMTPSKYLRSASTSIVMLTLLLILGLFSLMILFSYIISKSMLLPIKRLAIAMKEVGRKNFSISVSKHSNNEIGEICSGFNDMVVNLDKLFNLAVEREKQKRQFQMDMLKFQINPHFLHNTLNSIRYSAMIQNDHKTAEMLMILSRLLRNTLTKTGSEIELSQEIDNIKDYIFLQQVRYDSRLSIIYDINHRVINLIVPSMILQPIVENSIMHGLNERLNSGNYSEIKISAWLENENLLLLSVCDNGSGIPEEKISNILETDPNQISDSSHIGIKNIHERIQLQYGVSYGIRFESTVGVYTCVQVLLPVLKNEREESISCLR